MKAVQDLVATVVDFGVFQSLAEKLSETYRKVNYYTPSEWEFIDCADVVTGVGASRLTRCDDFMDPEIVKETDLYIFPDIVYGGTQKYLASIGKPVWGSLGMDDLELYRTRFLSTLKKLGLPVAHSVECVGLTELSDYLKTVENVWVKLNRFRQNMETWKHYTYRQSIRRLDNLAVSLGPLKEHVVFVVQDEIETDIEFGYDGWVINGKTPGVSFQGPELKNRCYLGSRTNASDLPEAVRYVNDAFVPMLQNYRAFFSTELRIKDDVPYFIDPTLRTPGLTGEHQWEVCRNIASVIWWGANGELLEPDYSSAFVGETCVHYTGDDEGWKTIEVPEQAVQWSKLYRYFVADDCYHFPPNKLQELGVIVAMADQIEEVIDRLKEVAELYENAPVDIEVDGFAQLLKQVQEAEKKGLPFTDEGVPIPDPETVL
jgi:hypothetical protein